MFNTSFNLYGFIILVSVLLGLFVIIKNSYDKDYNRVEIIVLTIYLVLGILFGGKTYSFFSGHHKTFEFLSLGLSSLGSLLGSIVMIIIYKFQFKKKIKDLLFILIPGVIIMYATGKIACFVTGCCLGLKYTGFGNIVYHYSNSVSSDYSYFPFQIIESIIFFLIFIYIYFIKKNKKYDIYKLMIACFWIKFSLDFFRLDHETKIISFNQVTCILCIIVISAFLYINKRKSLHKH